MTMMGWRQTLSNTIVVFALGLAATVAGAADFFRSIDDLPLAPGLSEAVDQGVEFDSPTGRIVTAVAAGVAGKNASVDGVRAFYRRVLPPLGWSPVTGDTYRREGERLTLRLEKTGKRVIVHVRLVPAAGN
jgi:hypothetical protein